VTETIEPTTPKKRGGGLNSMLLADLKQMAGGMGIAGAKSMKKAQLVEAIKAAQGGGKSDSQKPEKAPKAEKKASEADAPHGPGSHAALENGEAPKGFTIKGNAQSGKYHTPESPWYDKTVAEVWFDTVESAEAAGFTAAGAK